MSAVQAVSVLSPWPRTVTAFDRRNIERAHRVALYLTATAVASLAWLHPAGPGNSSPTDVVMVPAIAAVWTWMFLSRGVIRVPYGISIGLVIAAGCISGIAGPVVRGALVTVGYPQAPLIAVVQDIYLIVWCLSVVNLARSASTLRVLLAAWVYAAAFWAVLLIAGSLTGIQALSGVEVNNGVRAEGQFGDPNMASGYFAMSLFVLWSSDMPKLLWQRAVIFGILLTAMFYTGSNGGFLSLAVGLGFLALFTIRARYGAIVMVAAGCGVLLLGAAATQLINPSDIQQWARDSGIPLLRDGIGRGDSSANQRVIILQEAWKLFQENGPLGAGPGATQPILATSLAPFPHQAHDDYLAAVVERGFEGGVALVVLICAIAWRARHAIGGRLKADFAAVVPRREALIAALLGLATAAAYYQVLHFRHAWTLLAVIAAVQVWGRDWTKS